VKRVNGPERDVALHMPKVRRPCLRCREPFASTGPGNRLCRRCLLRAADMSPFAPGWPVLFAVSVGRPLG